MTVTEPTAEQCVTVTAESCQNHCCRTRDCHCEGAVTDDSDACVTVTAELHVTQAVTAAARVTVTAE